MKDPFDKIKSKSDFEKIYKYGRVILSTDKRIKAQFIFNDRKHKIEVGLVIPSKKGNSVWRNRVKRILKESLKLNSALFHELVNKKNTGIKIVFSPYLLNQKNSKKNFLNDLNPSVLDVIKKLTGDSLYDIDR
ncbi:MAG: ribonuclease P protein component [Ignavibacteriaceae bacterium]|nr:ribonuclease P protein component [Ignavibacteriaceae bacterium]